MTVSSQFKNKCTFCHAENVSREHLLPQWVSRAYPEDNSRSSLRNLTSTFKDGEWVIDNRNRKTNPLHTATLRSFCRDCNGGWMSKLESDAKEVIERIENAYIFINLSIEQVSTLALWVSLMSIKIELLDTENRVTSKEEINYLHQERRAPEDWHIWMAPAKSREFSYFNTPVELAVDPSATSTVFNSRAISIIIAGIVFTVVSAPAEYLRAIIPEADLTMRNAFEKLWPRDDKLISNFKLKRKITNTEAHVCSRTFCGAMVDQAIEAMKGIDREQ